VDIGRQYLVFVCMYKRVWYLWLEIWLIEACRLPETITRAFFAAGYVYACIAVVRQITLHCIYIHSLDIVAISSTCEDLPPSVPVGRETSPS
jgi:hypothetical protein